MTPEARAQSRREAPTRTISTLRRERRPIAIPETPIPTRDPTLAGNEDPRTAGGPAFRHPTSTTHFVDSPDAPADEQSKEKPPIEVQGEDGQLDSNNTDAQVQGANPGPSADASNSEQEDAPPRREVWRPEWDADSGRPTEWPVESADSRDDIIAVPVDDEGRVLYDGEQRTSPDGSTYSAFWLSLRERNVATRPIRNEPQTDPITTFTVSYTHLTLPTILRV